MLFFLFFLSLLLQVFSANDDFRVIKTSKGKIQGKRVNSYGGKTGFAFLGIPEAKPPVGRLRFRYAQEAAPWRGVLNATHYRAACLSNPKRTYKTSEGNPAGPVSEDCLYINVFASRTCLEKGNCAVMAVYHGGLFKFESPVIFREEVIVNNFANDERNVIVVTVPYRYGIIGYIHLTKEKSSIDTNIGTDDAIFALKWIQKEIKHFGGDPTRVTVFGHSAGANLAYLLPLAPSSKGLFHQVVAMSPAFEIDMDFQEGNVLSSRAIAEMVDCAKVGESWAKKRRVEEIISCLRKVPEEKLLWGYMELFNRTEEMIGTFVDGPGGIFPYYRKEAYSHANKMNFLVGTVSAEFRMARNILDKNGEVVPEKLDKFCSTFGYVRNYERPERFTEECNKYYNNPNITDQMDDDFVFYQGISYLADSFTKKGADVFIYNFDYWGTGDVFKKYDIHEEYLGPSHSEDFVYILGMHRVDANMKPKDYEIERTYTGIMANYVNYGDPTYKAQTWNKWTIQDRNYFLIDFDEKLRMPGSQKNFGPRVTEFWEGIIPKTAGDWSPLKKFPKTQDSFMAVDVFDGVALAWNGAKPIDKSDKAALDLWKVWEDWVQDQREATAKKSPKLRELTEETSESGGMSWLTISLAILVIILVAYIVAMKFYEWKKRRDYKQIIN